MKKVIVLALVTVMIGMLAAGCTGAVRSHSETYDITLQGAVFGGAGDDQIRTKISFDPAWITQDDNTKYNKDLAAFAAVLSDDVYFRAKDLEKGTQNRVLYEGEDPEEYEVTNFMKKLGFTEVEYIESFKAGNYAEDTNDSATMLLAHRTVDSRYDLYAVVLRGAFSAQEWISAFDPGCESESYTQLTGQHPDWTDRKVHKGFGIGADRAMDFIEEFMQKNDDPDLSDCMLITGHSRGAALAALVGAKMEERDDIRSCTYAFNGPGVIADERAKEYRTIFNIFDSNDYYVETMPFADGPFYRYGRDMTMAGMDSDQVKKEVADLKGRDDYVTVTSDMKAQYAEMFGKRFPDRESLYQMTTVTQTFDSEEEALTRAEMCQTLIGAESGLGLEGLCYLNNALDNGTAAAAAGEAVASLDNGKYEVSMTYCGQAVLTAYAKSLAYGAAACQGTLQLFEEDREACAILELLMENMKGVQGGHLLISSFVLSQYVQ